MSLISRLGRKFREKPKSTNLNLPALPTPREILEDIESCPSGDPIIAFATLIQKKGRQSSLLDKDFLEDPSTSQLANASPSSHLAFLAPYQTPTATSSAAGTTGAGSQSSLDKTALPEDPSGGASQGPHKRRGSLVTGGGGGGSSAKSKNKGTLDADQLGSYNKLKQFLLLFEKSEEILENLEPHFKRVENVLKQQTSNDNNVVDSCRDPSNMLPPAAPATNVEGAASLSKNITATLNGDVLKVEAVEMDPEDDDDEEEEEEDDEEEEKEDDNAARRTRQISSESDVGSSSLL